MQRRARGALFAAFVLILVLPSFVCVARERRLLDDGWRFSQGDDREASQREFDDSQWRQVRLPHDWSIEGVPHIDAPSGSGGGYLPTGVGWYRLRFDAPAAWRGQRITVEFDGVYHRTEVWINGRRLGRHAYGYTPVAFDLTPHVKLGAMNVLAVRVNNADQPNCRWYSGSGIYRHVWIEVAPLLHLNRGALFAYASEASDESATLMVEYAIANAADAGATVDLELSLLDPAGDEASIERLTATIDAGASAEGVAMLLAPRPRLWSPDSPALCTLLTRLKRGDRVLDELRTPIGIRTVRVSPERGLELNGQPLRMIGACIHHDNGPLGAAAFAAADVRRVALLKAAGFNAIRTAHNPPSTAFLAACDRLGMLVIDEAFDGWVKKKTDYDYHLDFADNWRDDLEAMVRRDRNHPSVVLWSIGNEMYERAEEPGAELSAQMCKAVRALDATRPITAACNRVDSEEAWRRVDRTFAPLDVAGYNYQLAVVEDDHQRVPDRIIVFSESFPKDAFECWDKFGGRPYVIGDFVWTGWDYVGEAGLGRVFAPGERARDPWVGEPQFPWHGAACGDIDLIGRRKPISHYRNILWDRGEKLYAAVVAPAPGGGHWQLPRWSLPPTIASWTWPGCEGQELEVQVYSRHDFVRLTLNGETVGEAPTGRDQQFRATFRVPYQPGELKAVGVSEDGAMEEWSLSTVGEASQISLRPERGTLVADGQDLAFVAVEITDAEGRWRPDAAAPVEYKLTGPGEIVAVGSSDLASTQSYVANPRATYQGRSLVIIRTSKEPGVIALTASSAGLAVASVEIISSVP